MAINIKKIYQLRFQKEGIRELDNVWQVLVKDYFQRFIHKDASVLDLGAGFCFFINHIQAKNKIALDANPDIKKFARKDVKVIIERTLKLKKFANNSLDHVFMSNFLEHLEDAGQATDLLKIIHRKLKKNGTIIILTPNFRLLGPAYFDFLDHKFIVTDKNLRELLNLTDFKIIFFKRRFLPYTSKTRLPKLPILVKLYLKIPLFHLLFGKQSLVIAKKK